MIFAACAQQQTRPFRDRKGQEGHAPPLPCLPFFTLEIETKRPNLRSLTSDRMRMTRLMVCCVLGSVSSLEWSTDSSAMKGMTPTRSRAKRPYLWGQG